MWVTKLLISPVKKRIFCPKTTKFGQKLAFLVNLGQAMQVFSVPCWWVSWWLWRVGCISQDTYLLYGYHLSVKEWNFPKGSDTYHGFSASYIFNISFLGGSHLVHRTVLFIKVVALIAVIVAIILFALIIFFLFQTHSSPCLFQVTPFTFNFVSYKVFSFAPPSGH